jgi:hypothetical protein
MTAKRSSVCNTCGLKPELIEKYKQAAGGKLHAKLRVSKLITEYMATNDLKNEDVYCARACAVRGQQIVDDCKHCRRGDEQYAKEDEEYNQRKKKQSDSEETDDKREEEEDEEKDEKEEESSSSGKLLLLF